MQQEMLRQSYPPVLREEMPPRQPLAAAPLLITGKEFALWQIKSFTQLKHACTEQLGSDSSSTAALASGCHAPCMCYVTSLLLQSCCHTCCCSGVTVPSKQPRRLFKHSYTGHWASAFSLNQDASDKTAWFVSQTLIQGYLQLPDGTARALKNRLCTDELLLGTLARVIFSLFPHLKYSYHLETQLQQHLVWHSSTGF